MKSVNIPSLPLLQKSANQCIMNPQLDIRQCFRIFTFKKNLNLRKCIFCRKEFATNSNFLIPISLQPDGVNL